MVIWVKELSGVMEVKEIAFWFKKEMIIKPFMALDDVEDEDIVIVSKSDSDKLSADFVILIYEDFFSKITQNIYIEARNNYEYYYLKNAIDYGKQHKIDTIITGSSYALFGIDESMLNHQVNCSLASQDLYYSTKNIFEIFKVNKGIKNIVLCNGYYCFHMDLSKTQNPIEIGRVSNVYQPLYNDIHNCILLKPHKNVLMESDIFDIEKILNQYSLSEYQRYFFHETQERHVWATKVWSDKSKRFSDLTESEKFTAGKIVAEGHNSAVNRKLSYRQNTKIFMELVSFCAKNDINLVFVVTPASRFYRKYFSDKYKGMFYNVLNKADWPIHVLDLFEDDTFCDNDFNDVDHLEDSGATKLTNIIFERLSSI